MNRKLFWAALLLFSLALLAGCASSPLSYDYHTLTRFSGFQRFSWLDAPSSGPQLDTFAVEAIRTAVEQALGRRGLQQASVGGDLGIIYHVGAKDKINVAASGYEYWPDRWAWGGYLGGAADYLYPRDALILDVVDTRQQKLVWRGSFEKTFRRGSQEAIVARIHMAVDSIMSAYPPPGGL